MSSCFPVAPFYRAHRSHPFAAAYSELTPFVNTLDEVSRTFDHIFNLVPQASQRQAPKLFQPRFDVREVESAYELRGELPGVDANNLNVEFTDANTLVVRGRTESETAAGNAPTAAVAAEQHQDPTATDAAKDTEATATAADNTDAASVHSNDSTSSYVKPSVEDEADEEHRAAAGTPTSETATPATQPATETAPTEQKAEPQSHYWVSERSTGSFQRSFTFPGRIDQENVTANLKNGVLEVVVPKAKEPEVRRIEIQ